MALNTLWNATDDVCTSMYACYYIWPIRKICFLVFFVILLCQVNVDGEIFMTYFTPAQTVAQIKHTLGFMPINQVKASKKSFEQFLQILELGHIDIACAVLEELIEHHAQYEADWLLWLLAKWWALKLSDVVTLILTNRENCLGALIARFSSSVLK